VLGIIADLCPPADFNGSELRRIISKDRNRLTREIERLEFQIEGLENKKSEIEIQMANPETYQKSGLAATLPYEYASVKEDLQACYERWEAAQVELEEILKRLV